MYDINICTHYLVFGFTGIHMRKAVGLERTYSDVLTHQKLDYIFQSCSAYVFIFPVFL